MLLPRVVAAALALRQAADILPVDYCRPECPACKTNILEFDAATSCVDSSQFLTNCGACQQCILTYSIQNGSLALLPDLQNTLSSQISRCAGTGGSAQVSQIASQASRLSDLNVQLATLMPSAAAISAQVSASRATAPRHDPSLSSMLATATWSSQFEAGMASVTAASLSSVASAASAASVASRLSNITSGVTRAPETSSTAVQSTAANSKAGPGPKLNQSWVAGPVIGSILGMSTVFVVIYCTRVKHRREEWELGPVKPNEKEDDEDPAQPPEDPGKPQLHGECMPVREMENTEVIPPVELPVPDPVGMELLTPRSATEHPKEWPLPISPLPALFASVEMRDQRSGAEESPKHETFYHR
ncbi:hypothetical protein BJ875DRAFT_442940 [Amylocarpus encephaloides]|uniref:Uncharacterized protein n=1 Tax=Amylocarpus encephaloides TaxID=45428 RepID=A0A9P7YFF8_9HELO|nr:hypothetical protein BJ875DRAFT_442940 [Amylocarpus encephaloides]